MSSIRLINVAVTVGIHHIFSRHGLIPLCARWYQSPTVDTRSLSFCKNFKSKFANTYFLCYDCLGFKSDPAQ